MVAQGGCHRLRNCGVVKYIGNGWKRQKKEGVKNFIRNFNNKGVYDNT